jgi:pimeloyl-ACP methyl ester carboxylesterase
MAAEALKSMPEHVIDLRINERIPGAGHWTQQEAPAAVNEAILRFLTSITGS